MSCLPACSNIKRKNDRCLNDAMKVRKSTNKVIRLSDQEIGSLMDKFHTFSINHVTLHEEVQFESHFRQMLGVLGGFFIAKRMFCTIQRLFPSPNKDEFIRMTDYILYSDLLYMGQEDDKAKMSFYMLDIEGKGRVSLDSYRDFWQEFLFMYGELLQSKIEYNNETEQLVRDTFKEIATSRNSHVGDEYFDLKDFEAARSQPTKAEIFKWLDCPGQYIETYLKQQEEKHQKIDLVKFEDYHEQVRDTLNEIIMQIQSECNLTDAPNFFLSTKSDQRAPTTIMGAALNLVSAKNANAPGHKSVGFPIMSSKSAVTIPFEQAMDAEMRQASFKRQVSLRPLELLQNPKNPDSRLSRRFQDNALNNKPAMRRTSFFEIAQQQVMNKIKEDPRRKSHIVSPNASSDKASVDNPFVNTTKTRDRNQSSMVKSKSLFNRVSKDLDPVVEDNDKDKSIGSSDSMEFDNQQEAVDENNGPFNNVTASKPHSGSIKTSEMEVKKQFTDPFEYDHDKDQERNPTFAPGLNDVEKATDVRGTEVTSQDQQFTAPKQFQTQQIKTSGRAFEEEKVNPPTPVSAFASATSARDQDKISVSNFQRDMVGNEQLTLEQQRAQKLIDLIYLKMESLDEICKKLTNEQNNRATQAENDKNPIAKRKSMDAAKEEDVGPGSFVRFDSENFDIIINILIGIRRRLSCLVEIPGKILDKYEYKKRLGQENEWISNSGKTNSVSCFKFYDFAPLVFQQIRQREGITEEQYMKSLGPEQILNSFWTNNFKTLTELCSSGQSGSLFYFTSDLKYMLKTIPYREFEHLRNILQDYNQHLKRNRNSLIIRFYGLHQVVWHDSNGKQQIRYITIMGNIFQCFQVGMRYDLKGSTQGRTLLRKGQKPEDRDPASLKTAMKDNDFTKYQKSVNFVELFANESDKRLKSPISQMKPDIKFKKHQSVRKEPQDLLEILESDARFLSRCSIIDYSLLLGEIVDDPLEVMATTELDPSLGKGVYWSESGQPYIIGVIDPLTCFNFQKQVEYSAKWLKHGTSMSCVPPNIYAQRFIDFCKRSFTTKIINDKKQHPVYNFASKNLKVPDLDKCRPHSGSAMALADDLLGQTAQFGSSQGTSKKKKPPVLDSLDLERANDTRI